MTAIAHSVEISFSVNGRTVHRHTPVRLSLADFLRHQLGLTGTHVGCEQGVCGACTLLVDGEIVRSCLMLAVQADGCTVETIEGLSASGKIKILQDAFVAHNGVQCGFCTPGMLITARELLKHEPSPTRERIRDFLSGNYCRCTGYQAIIDAIEAAANGAVATAEGAA
jgi:aerobic carbon-monoxide dehydrogenase small subunit